MDKLEPVNIKIQILLGIIPFGWLWALYRIEKIGIGLLIFIPSGFAVGIISDMFFPFPYGLAISLSGNMIIWAYFVRKWSIEWNRKISLY